MVYFISTCLSLSLSLQIKSFYHSTLLPGLLAIWYARNLVRFEETYIHFTKAWVVVQRAIKDANSLHGGRMNNFVLDLSIYFPLGWKASPPKLQRLCMLLSRVRLKLTLTGMFSFSGECGVWWSFQNFKRFYSRLFMVFY